MPQCVVIADDLTGVLLKKNELSCLYGHEYRKHGFAGIGRL